MANEDTPITPAKTPVPAPTATPAPSASAEVIDAWANDLIGNLPDLRETENYNQFRTAIADLKTRI